MRVSARARPLGMAVARRLPQAVLRLAEELAQFGQGKGWGSATVGQEVAASLSFLSPGHREGVVALDVGANRGDWTAALLRAAPGAAIHCFEPSPAALVELASRFSSDARVDIVPVALAERSGRAALWADRAGSGLASLTRRDLSHIGLQFDHEDEVEVMTLDEWSARSGVRPDLVKLDVEGHELAVLVGGLRTLEHVQVLQFEFGGCNIDSRTYLRDIWSLLTSRGFEVARIAPRGPVRLDRYREIDETFRTTNFVAFRPSRMEASAR